MDNTFSFLIPGRLSFHQLLLVLTYTCLRFGLPSQMNDLRQVQDILRRSEKDWEPRVGPEGLEEFRSSASSVMESKATTAAWEMVHMHLAQDHIFLPVSPLNLRHQLIHTLFRVGQISSQSLNTIHIPDPIPPPRPLRGGSSMALLCLSLSVPIVGLSATMLDPHDDALNEMVCHLNESPLFSGGLSFNHLKSAMSSLEMLFSDEDQDVTNSALEYVPFYSEPQLEIQETDQEHDTTNSALEYVPLYSEPQLEVQERQMHHYGMYLFGEAMSVLGNLVAGRKRPSGALVENGLRKDIKILKKCHTEI